MPPNSCYSIEPRISNSLVSRIPKGDSHIKKRRGCSAYPLGPLRELLQYVLRCWQEKIRQEIMLCFMRVGISQGLRTFKPRLQNKILVHRRDSLQISRWSSPSFLYGSPSPDFELREEVKYYYTRTGPTKTQNSWWCLPVPPCLTSKDGVFVA